MPHSMGQAGGLHKAAAALVAIGLAVISAALASFFLRSALGLMGLLFCVFFIIFLPKLFWIFFGMFILIQDLFVYNLGKLSALGMLVNRLDEVLIITAFAVLLSTSASRRRQLWQGTSVDGPLLILILVAMISTAASRMVPLRLSAFDLLMLTKGFMVFYACSVLDVTEKDLGRFVRVFCLVGLFVLAVGLVDLAVGEPFKIYLYGGEAVFLRRGILSVSSIFFHPGELGWFMAWLTCFAFAFYLVIGKQKYLLLSLLFSFGALSSMQMKPMGGLLLALTVGSMSVGKKFRPIFAVGILLVVALLVFGPLLGPMFSGKMQQYFQANDPMNVARNAIYLVSLKIAKDYMPLGSGLATYGGWIANLYYSPLYIQYGLNRIWGLEEGGTFLTDTFWPYVIGQFGVLGLIVFLWVLWRMTRLSLQAIKNAQAPMIRAFALGVFMVLVEGLAESVAIPTFTKPPEAYFIFGACGILVAVLRGLKDSEANASPG